MGAFVPLVVLAVVAELTGPDGTAPGGGEVAAPLSTQNAVVAASFCTLAWLVSRSARWPVAVAAWTTAAAGCSGSAARGSTSAWTRPAEPLRRCCSGCSGLWCSWSPGPPGTGRWVIGSRRRTRSGRRRRAPPTGGTC
ncbi:hypothetical protein NKG94_48420 [Micromonospora sp. M12]